MQAHADPRQEMRKAGSPLALPRSAWKSVALRTKDELDNDNLTIVSAGCAFFALLAMFPALTALISVYGLVADPNEVANQLGGLKRVLPDEAFGIIQRQAELLASRSAATLSLSLIVTVLLALWSAGKVSRAVMGALNIVYEEREERGFFSLNARVMGLTTGGILGFLIGLLTIAAIPAILRNVGLGRDLELLISLIRWPLLAISLMVALAVLYRMGPSRNAARWQWVSPGAFMATLLWLAGSIGFSLYVSYFGNYSQTYGSFGAVIILLLWFYLSFFIILLGGELNSELEAEVAADTTVGAPDPLGHRGATTADRVAGVHPDNP